MSETILLTIAAAGCPSCHPTVSLKGSEENSSNTGPNQANSPSSFLYAPSDYWEKPATLTLNSDARSYWKPSGAVRTEPSGAIRTPPGAVPTPTVIQLLNIQKEINRTQIICSLLAQHLHFVVYKTNMENEKNNVTSRYAVTYTTINCKM